MVITEIVLDHGGVVFFPLQNVRDLYAITPLSSIPSVPAI